MTARPAPLRLLALLPIAALGLAGCSAAAPDDEATDDGGIVLVASTNVYGDLAETIGGDRVEVTSLIDNPDQDPHEFEADARAQLALSQADVVVENGGGYDDFIDTMLSAADNGDATVINAVDLSGKDTGEGELNEHVWYDYPTVGKVVDAIADALSEADPDGADTYRANADELQDGLSALEDRVAALEPSGEGKTVTITEPVPLYLLEALGLEDVTPEEFSEAIEEDTDVPPAVLQETLDLYSADPKPIALVQNEQTGGPQTDQVIAAAEAAGVTVIGVTETLPAGTHYLDWQAGVVDELEAALQG